MSPSCDKILQKLISIPTHVLALGSNIISPLRLCVHFLLHVLKLKNSLSLFCTPLQPLKDFCYIYFSCISTGRASSRKLLKFDILLYVLPVIGRSLCDFSIVLHLLLSLL